MEIVAYKCEVCGKLYEDKEDMGKCYNRCNGKIDFNIKIPIGSATVEIGYNFHYWEDLYKNDRKDWYMLWVGGDGGSLTEDQLNQLIEGLKKIKTHRKTHRMII